MHNLKAAVLHPSESTHAREIMQQLEIKVSIQGQTLKCYVFWWEDDVEPNRLSKVGRGSIWVLTMTIGTIFGDGHNMNNTYPIAVGKKGENHDAIIGKIENEMREIRKGKEYYIGSIKKKARIQFSDFAHLADQPERRSINHLAAGNAMYAARFGVSANHKECFGVLKACEWCDKSNQSRLGQIDLNTFLPFPECSDCMNWDVLKEGPLGYTNPPANYPLLPDEAGASHDYETSPYCRLVRVKTAEGGTKQVIKPFCMTFEGLKGAVELAHECFVNGGWSGAMAQAYLKVENLNDDFIEKILEMANRCYSLAVANSNETEADERMQEVYRLIKEDAAKNPTLYQRVPFPPTWTRDDIELFYWINVIMHLLCLGVIPTMMTEAHDWLKATKKDSDFRKKSAGYLDSLVNKTIEWINIQPYIGDSFGHWVSENYHGFARLAPWFYQNLPDLVPEKIELPPEELLHTWTKAHSTFWLQSRGLDISGSCKDGTASAAEMKERVKMAMVQVPPPGLLPVKEHPVELVQHLIVSLYKLMECVMATEVTEELVVRAHYAVRVFLSAFEALRTSISKKQEKGEKFMFLSYNLACLINLPDMMRRFGPLRQLWEGGPRGEGFLRFAKPLMKQGFRTPRWHEILMEKMLTVKAFDNILPQQTNQLPTVNSDDALNSRKGQFQQHKSQFDLK